MTEDRVNKTWIIISLIIAIFSFFSPTWAHERPASLSTDLIRPFLNDSLVVWGDELARAPAIVAIDDQHLLGGRCFRCFVTVCNPRCGDLYGIYRAGKNFFHPKTGACLGKEAVFLGVARLVQEGCGTQTSTFVLERGLKEIKRGDKLLPYREMIHEACIPLKMPDNCGEGYIVAILGGLSQAGQYSMVAITGGLDKRRQRGDILGIYQTKFTESERLRLCREFQRRLSCRPEPKIEIIPPKVGEMMVYTVFDKISFALVTNSYRPIYLQDEVKWP